MDTEAADLDRHMAGNGQAATNAALLGRMLQHTTVASGGRILMPGAGTGQFLDYADAEALGSRHWTFTDLNERFLSVLSQRLRRHPRLQAVVHVDDSERSRVEGPFDAVVAVLLLEHVDWKKVLEAWARLTPTWIGLIIQRNDAEASLLTARRTLTPSMERFRATAHPHLIPEEALTRALGALGYALSWRAEEPVPDAKFMIALLYRIATAA